MQKKIYIASSWRNQHHNSVVRACRQLGHLVYDFKNPPNGSGFGWEQLDAGWQNWTPSQYLKLLNHSIAEAGFQSDMKGLDWADTCVLLLPCGRSAHLEMGYAIGKAKSTFIFISNEQFQPDLMYKMADMVSDKIESLYYWLGEA